MKLEALFYAACCGLMAVCLLGCEGPGSRKPEMKNPYGCESLIDEEVQEAYEDGYQQGLEHRYEQRKWNARLRGYWDGDNGRPSQLGHICCKCKKEKP